MNLSFNLQAVGYSRSSLPRGTQYNTQTKQITIAIHNLPKNNLQTQRTVTKQKHTLLHSCILIKKVCHNTALGHAHILIKGGIDRTGY